MVQASQFSKTFGWPILVLLAGLFTGALVWLGVALLMKRKDAICMTKDE